MNYKQHIIGLLLIIIFIIVGSCTSNSPDSNFATAQESIARDETKEWDLVILGDSDMWLSYEYYVPMFEEDLGIDIVVHNETRPGTLSPTLVLRGNQHLQNLISEAEIIVFNVPFVFPGIGGACFIESLSLEEDGCFSITQEEYTEWTSEMITLIKELVGSHGAMIRLQNMFVPLEYWRQDEVLRERLDTCLACFASYWDAQAKVAEEEGIYLVDVFSLLHGFDGEQDPYEKGYFGSDIIHVNDEGAKAIAELYRSVGYEFWLPE
jgi:lysophospholipase L1-like esterase